MCDDDTKCFQSALNVVYFWRIWYCCLLIIKNLILLKLPAISCYAYSYMCKERHLYYFQSAVTAIWFNGLYWIIFLALYLPNPKRRLLNFSNYHIKKIIETHLNFALMTQWLAMFKQNIYFLTINWPIFAHVWFLTIKTKFWKTYVA